MCTGVNGLQVWGAADELAGMASLAGEQDRQGAANAGGIERRLLTLEQILQAQQAVDLDVFLHLVAQRGRGRARTRAKFEGVRLGKADTLNEGEGGSKIGLGLAGKTDDDIGGERH